MNPVILAGVDGSNPLGFFAALGVLEILADQGVHGARLAWRDEGVWRPVFTGVEGGLEKVVESIESDRQSCAQEAALCLEYEGERDLKPPPELFRSYLADLVAHSAPERRRGVDWAGAFATDVAVDNKGKTKPTALHFTAGQQQFLKNLLTLRESLTADDIREALVGPWLYERPLPVMGWDATVTRDHALRASDPSTDKKLGVPGADWLAARGLTCFPVAPVGKRIVTTGCVGGWKTGSLRWGLWMVPLGREVVRSVMRLDIEALGADERQARGIGVAFECGIRRSDQGGYGTFDPARLV